MSEQQTDQTFTVLGNQLIFPDFDEFLYHQQPAVKRQFIKWILFNDNVVCAEWDIVGGVVDDVRVVWWTDGGYSVSEQEHASPAFLVAKLKEARAGKFVEKESDGE